MGISHFTFNFCSWNQSCNGVNYNHINCAGTYQSFCNFQSLLTCVRLRNQQCIHINAQCTCINRVKSMLHVDECSRTAVFLSFRNTVQCQSSFTGRFRSVYFYNSAPRQTADAKGKV